MAQNATDPLRLYVVSREPCVVRPLWSITESNSWLLETAGSGWEALERIQTGIPPNLLLLEVRSGEADGLHVLRWLRRLNPELPIIVLSLQKDVQREKEAVRLGAREFLVSPFDERQLELAIQRQLPPNDRSHADLTTEDVEQLTDDTFFVGASPVMQKVRAQAEVLGQSDVPVLIIGEPGTGKDTVARLIHKRSVRSGFSFLKVNCSAVSADLLERELFGYQDSRSGGSHQTRSSKFELCGKGTIFLDDITEMPLPLQKKLLHLIQEKQVLQPGTNRHIDVDARILASSGIDIERALSEKKLRLDLYYRLSAFTVHVPALRFNPSAPVVQRKEEQWHQFLMN